MWETTADALFHWGRIIMDYDLCGILVKNILMLDLFRFCLLQMLTDGLECCNVFIRLSFWRHPFTAEHPLTLILTAPIHCRASIDSHSDGTHSLQSIHWLSFWRHPFTAEHPLTLILTAPIHCRASIDSHSDGTHSLQSIHWLSFWRHPFTAAETHFLQTWWRNKLIIILDELRMNIIHATFSIFFMNYSFNWSKHWHKIILYWCLWGCTCFLFMSFWSLESDQAAQPWNLRQSKIWRWSIAENKARESIRSKWIQCLWTQGCSSVVVLHQRTGM